MTKFSENYYTFNPNFLRNLHHRVHVKSVYAQYICCPTQNMPISNIYFYLQDKVNEAKRKVVKDRLAEIVYCKELNHAEKIY